MKEYVGFHVSELEDESSRTIGKSQSIPILPLFPQLEDAVEDVIIKMQLGRVSPGIVGVRRFSF